MPHVTDTFVFVMWSCGCFFTTFFLFLGTWTWVSGYLGIWVSGYLGIWVSGYLGIWVSGYLGIWVSGYLGIWVSGYLGIWVSGYLGIWVYPKTNFFGVPEKSWRYGQTCPKIS